MNENSKEIQLQFQGYANTPTLWKDTSVYNLEQFDFSTKSLAQFNFKNKPEIRLGKRVEQFSFYQFQQDDTIQIISENLQIQDGKRTVGELDCLLIKDKTAYHVEIVYKFYLFDKSVGETEIEHWIGPNRRDSFHQKLMKLKNKQLPLLQNKFCEKYLEKLSFNFNAIKQQVHFKAQLFVPFDLLGVHFSEINNNCIAGFYISYKELTKFKKCKFFIPQKLNWLQQPQAALNWMKFEYFNQQILIFHQQKSAPLCWLKNPNGQLQKFFVVWW